MDTLINNSSSLTALKCKSAPRIDWKNANFIPIKKEGKELISVDKSSISDSEHYISRSVTIDFIDHWIAERALKYNLSEIPKLAGRDCSLDYITSLIYMDAKKSNTSGITKELLKNYFSVWTTEERSKAIENLSSYLEYSSSNLLVEKFVMSLTGEKNKVDVAVFKHWIANCKRKLKGISVKDHIMPILYGKTGCGKSVAIHKLTFPISDLTMEAPLSFVNDSRNDFNFTKKLVIIFDELSWASKTCMSSLKQKISSPTIDSRLLGTSSNYRDKNMSNFIGASNQEVKDVIKDPTSARRYYELTTLEKVDWNSINEIDYLKLWRGVDASTKIDYLIDVRSSLKEKQENIRSLDSVEEWLVEEQFKEHDTLQCSWYAGDDLFKLYMKWMKEQNREKFAFSKNMFGRKLTSYIGKSKTTRGKRVYLFSNDVKRKRLEPVSEDFNPDMMAN